MSGRKYSKVELAAQVREAIGCRTAAEEALMHATGLVRSLNEAARTTGALGNQARSANTGLTEIREELKSMTEAFAEAKLMRLELGDIRARRGRVDDLRKRLEEIARSCREGCGAAGVRAEAARLFDEASRERHALEPWLGPEYASFVSQARELLDETDREIRATGSAHDLAARVPSLDQQHVRMLERVSERRASDAERRYVAEALQRVCTEELGFAVTARPQKTPLDDLVMEVDTFAYGIILFRLQLDGTLRSQSDLGEASCPANFQMIEQRLRSLGVASSFRYESDQQPVVIEKDEKPAPQDQRVAGRESSR